MCDFTTTISSAQAGDSGKAEREELLARILFKHEISIPTDLEGLRRYAGSHANARAFPGEDGNQTSRRTPDSCEALDPDRWQNGNSEGTATHTKNAPLGYSHVVLEHFPRTQTYVQDHGKTCTFKTMHPSFQSCNTNSFKVFDGGFSVWAFFEIVQRATHTSDEATTVQEERSLLSDNVDEAQQTYRHCMTEPPEALYADLRTSLLAALPPSIVLEFLSSTFFQYAQSNYLFVHPTIFSKKLSAFTEGTHEFDPQNKQAAKRPVEFISVLFMILALGSQFAELEQDRECL